MEHCLHYTLFAGVSNGITLRKFLRNRVWQRPSGVQPNNYTPRRIASPVRRRFYNLAPSLKGRWQEWPSKEDFIRCGIHSGEGMTEDLWRHTDYKFYFYLTYSEQWAKSLAKCLLCHQKATRLSLVEELHLRICNSYGVMKAGSLGPLPNSLPQFTWCIFDHSSLSRSPLNDIGLKEKFALRFWHRYHLCMQTTVFI